MPVSSVNTSQVQYVQTFEPVNVKEYPDRYVYTYEEPGTTGKKIGVGAASYFIPGLGQAINGQWGKAAGFFAGINGCRVILGSIIINPLLREIINNVKNKSKINAEEQAEKLTKLMTKNFARVIIGSLLLTAANIWGIVDAVKNAKSKRDITVMKEQAPKQKQADTSA